MPKPDQSVAKQNLTRLHLEIRREMDARWQDPERDEFTITPFRKRRLHEPRGLRHLGEYNRSNEKVKKESKLKSGPEPGEVRLKQFVQELANKECICWDSAYARLRDKGFKGLNLRRVNKRVVYVKIS